MNNELTKIKKKCKLCLEGKEHTRVEHTLQNRREYGRVYMRSYGVENRAYSRGDYKLKNETD